MQSSLILLTNQTICHFIWRFWKISFNVFFSVMPGSSGFSVPFTSVKLNYAKHGRTSALSEFYELSLAYICDICNEFILNTVSGIMTASSVSLRLNDIQNWSQFPLDCSPWKQTKPFLHSFLANRYGFYVILRFLHRFTKCDSCWSPDNFLSCLFGSFHSSVSLMVIYCTYRLPSMVHLIRLAAEDKLTANVEHRNILFRQPCNF